jgi:integrase
MKNREETLAMSGSSESGSSVQVGLVLSWWGRWDLDPGSPTPQAGILNQSSRNGTEIPTKSVARRRPQQPTKYETQIINTLLKVTNEAKAENTIHSIDKSLTQLSTKTDLDNPEAVKNYIATAINQKTGEPLTNASKAKLCFAYEWYCKTNEIQWTKPRYKWEETIPIIPTTENVTKIISASTRRYATIFTILAETGAEGEELHKTHKNQIDLENGVISIKGTKGHASAVYKLKQATAEMLREYIAKNPQEYPFPKPKIMAQIWRRERNQLADNLKQPDLKKIPMKNLRNYSGARLYYTLKDPIAVMRHLRHKKLETTMHYIRAITLDGEDEYTCKATTDNKEAQDLIEHGFQYVLTTPNGLMLFRKRR